MLPGCSTPDRRRDPFVGRPRLAAAALLLFSIPVLLPGLVGCSATLSHAGVSNPIVLGDRLHVGDEPEFDSTEMLEEYAVENDHMVVFAISGWAREKNDDPVVVAESLLHINRYRAVQDLRVRAGVIGLFILVGGGGGAGISGKGEVMEIIPVRTRRSEASR